MSDGLLLAVWDVDGTLVDSRAVILVCMQAAMRQVGLAEPDYEAVRQIVGLGLKEACAVLAPQLAPEGIERLVTGYKQTFREMHADPGFTEPLYDGAAQTLARLDGRPLAMTFGPARAGDIRTSLGNPSAATAVLGVRAKTSLELGLQATVGALAAV